MAISNYVASRVRAVPGRGVDDRALDGRAVFLPALADRDRPGVGGLADLWFLAVLSALAQSGGYAGRRFDADGSYLDHHSTGTVPGVLRVGRAAVLPHL